MRRNLHKRIILSLCLLSLISCKPKLPKESGEILSYTPENPVSVPAPEIPAPAIAPVDKPEDLYKIGIENIYGKSQTKNRALGLMYLQQAANGGFYPAKYALATLYFEDNTLLADKLIVVEYLEPAANNGVTDAQVKLAKILVQFGMPHYDKVAYFWAKKAAENNNIDAVYMLGTFYFEGIGTEVDYGQAFHLFSQLAEVNYPLAQLKLGQLYYYGFGVEKDIDAARKWFLKSASRGIAEASKWVSTLGIEELNVDDNLEDYKEWIEHASMTGDLQALYLKGTGILYGKNGFAQNVNKGMEILEEVAHKQYGPAQRELAKIHELGLFDYGNENKAFYWYLEAAKNDDAYAQHQVAKLYYRGQGTHRDFIQSYVWASLAAVHQIDEARVLLEEITNRLNNEELREAQQISEIHLHSFGKKKS